MEVIKKTIKQALTTGITETCTGDCRVIIPDKNAYYNIKVLLTKQNLDFGFFDAYTGITKPTPTTSSYIITGESTSRLSELKKYTITSDFYSGYRQSIGLLVDGVNVDQSTFDGNSGIIKYYIDGITYYDIIDENGNKRTTFSFIGQGYTSPDFINSPIYKDPNKYNLVSNPKVADDVFIIRQQVSAFDKNYKLNYVRNLSDLTTYAGGRFFNIVNNI